MKMKEVLLSQSVFCVLLMSDDEINWKYYDGMMLFGYTALNKQIFRIKIVISAYWNTTNQL